MEIGPLTRVSAGAPVATDAAQDGPGTMRELVMAIRGLNRPELLEQGREFKLRPRAAGRQAKVVVVDRETGELLDEFEPEEVLLMAQLERERDEGI